MHARRSGFTLVELAIVLVILGLLVGGILAGKALIHSSQLRAITTEQAKLITAITNFKEQYSGYPGDITNATQYWGQDPNGCPTNGNTVPGIATCDGNGDGYIGNGADGNFDIPSSAALSAEVFRATQQLADAGFIEGSYTGVSPAENGIIGVNAYRSKYPKGGWVFMYRAGNPHAGYPDAGDVGTVTAANYLIIGSAGDYGTDGALVLAADALKIDSKMDDGMPATGSVRASSAAYGCASSWSTDATYQLVQTNPVCALYFMVN